MIEAKELFDKMLEENAFFTYTEMMVEFAKMHVQEALKQASEKAEIVTEYENPVNPSMGSFEVVDKCSILDAYSLDNVK
jgi:hypothetical protein